MSRSIELAGRRIGPGLPVYVVAEISANHHGDLEAALRIVAEAKSAGADAVKLQTYRPDALTMASDKPWFRVGGGTLWDGRTLHDLYSEARTPWEWHAPLAAAARELGLQLFSSPFDAEAVFFLEELGVPAHKIASFELVDLGLIRLVARTGKPAIISTGMASLSEVEEAVRAFRLAGGTQLALLKCTSAYPSVPEEANLRTLPHMAEAFDVPVGLSDHTPGIAVPVAAVVLGACLIEKHLTLSRSLPGPDSAFSLEPSEFRAMVEAVRVAERAVGGVSYGPTPHEQASLAFRRSLFVTGDMKAGEVFDDSRVRSIRPGLGLHPRHLQEVLGCRAAQDIEAGTPLSWRLVRR
jgi:N-acetylneuraminate synthase